MQNIDVFFQNLLCCTVFFLGFPRRKHFAVRFLASSLPAAWLLYSISEVMCQTKFLTFLYFLIEFAALYVLFHFSFQTSWEQALYSASAGRATQHLIYSGLNLVLLKAIGMVSWWPSGLVWDFVRSLLLYLPPCLLFYFLFARKMDTSHYKEAGFRRHMNLISVIILFVCIGITRFAKDGSVWDRNAFIARNLYAVTCCVLCLIMQFELCKQAELTKEMAVLRMLWIEDSKHLAERKDTIEMINMKCHDILHRLEDYHLPLSNSEEQEIESLIRIYDQSYRTGNQTLDVLLTDQALLCEKSRIQLSFMGDGDCLRFLTEAEIYSLFGNALSNAMEASCQLEEEKRQISIIIRSSGELVSISVTNYYRGELQFEAGLPVTTRSDPEGLHGYGMKSMRAIARKYGGEMTVRAEGGVFVLNAWLLSGGAA